MTVPRPGAAAVRRRTGTVLAAAGAIIAAGLTWGLVVGQPRIGVAVSAAVVMWLPWRPVGAPPLRAGEPAAGWRLIGAGVGLVGGVEGVAEWIGLPLQWRTVTPAAAGLPVVVLGLWWALVRSRRASRTALDAALLGLAVGLLGWRLVIRHVAPGSVVSGQLILGMVVVAACLISLMCMARSSSRRGSETALVVGAVGAFATGALLVGDADMIMRGWSAAADASGHVLAVAAVVLGQRRTSDADGRPGPEVTVRWFPTAVAAAALAVAIVEVSWGLQDLDPVDVTLTAGALLALALRTTLMGRDWAAGRRRLERLAHYDDVTGLRSRAWLSASLPERLEAGQVVGVIMLDIDRFKLINDGLGHHVGDRVLAVVGERLRRIAATDEVVRLGGDEFLVLVGPRSPLALTALAERFRTELAQPVTFESYALRPTASIGVAPTTLGAAASDLLRDADAALYRAKESGRDVVVTSDDDLRQRSARRTAIAELLPTAIARGELTLHHQPVIDAATGQVVLVEALARWTSPTLGVVTPSEFVPVAAQHGLIGALDRSVVEQACASVAHLDRTPGHQGVAVSVNVSTSRLGHLDFADGVMTALRRSGVAPERLVLEVTESALLDPDGIEMGQLRQLVGAGVSLAVDDFGSGYSALGYLRGAPVSLLKLDPSFTARLDRSARPTLVGAMIDMAHELGIRVAGEGVETERQRERLTALGCDLLQGNLFAPPAPLADDVHAGSPPAVHAVA